MAGAQKTILICPLNWGIGHASRCVPIIRLLRSMKVRVIVAADGKPLSFLAQQFPDLDFEIFSSHTPAYSKRNHQTTKLLQQLPSFIENYQNDQKKIPELVKRTGANAVISDNRFGAFSRQVPSVYITHQLQIPLSGNLSVFSPLASRIHRQIISHYNQCWIPDFPDHNSLAGKLSTPFASFKSFQFIGPLSRFEAPSQPPEKKKDRLLVLLSGPEPQRSILENIILNQLQRFPVETVMLRGLPDQINIPECPAHVQLLNHADDQTLFELLTSAQHIIARAGYSTIMDLYAIGRSATLIPTPGQAEQEYLANFLSHKGLFSKALQKSLELKTIIRNPELSLPSAIKSNQLLLETVTQWISKI